MLSQTGSNCITSSLGQGDKKRDRVVINVGGTRHECYISTIQNFPDTRLYWIAETALKMADFDPDGNEFFFDRHPSCFQNILNYCRTGKLHCPNDVCGPLFEQELAFWGVDELMMEPCCWGAYTQHRNAHENLRMFDEMHGEEQEIESDDLDAEEIESLQRKNDKKGRLRKLIYNMRPKIWAVVERPFSSVYAQICAFVSMSVIVLSLATFCMETVDYFEEQKHLFENLEYLYCAFFTIEFIVRLVCCPSWKEFFKSVMTWIDFVSTMQFYFSFFARTNTLDFLFVSRLIRIFRLFRFFKKLSGMQVIGQTLKASANELFLLVLIVCIPMIIFSTLMYYAEQNTIGRDFNNIPGTFWWAIVTMTTVGYGDDVPKSTYGKMIGAMCACSGVLIVALPVSVIGSNFTLYYSYAQARMRLPKRRSPALVSADKALMNNNPETSMRGHAKNINRDCMSHDGMVFSQVIDSHATTPTDYKGAVPKTFEALSSVLADIAAPMRERRHALQPSTNPVTKSAKTKSRKRQSKETVASALITSTNMKMRISSPVTFEHTVNGVEESEESAEYEKIAKNKSFPSFSMHDYSSDQKERHDDHFGNDLDSNNTLHRMNAMKRLSQSDDSQLSYDVQRFPRYGRKRIIHCNIAQYVPKKISGSELKARRKLSQQLNNHNHTNEKAPDHGEMIDESVENTDTTFTLSNHDKFNQKEPLLTAI